MCVTHNPWNRRWVRTPSSMEDDFTRLRTVELKIVVLRPGLYVVKFGGSRWFIADRYYKVSIIRVLTQKISRCNSFEVPCVDNIDCRSNSWSLDYTGGDVFEFGYLVTEQRTEYNVNAHWSSKRTSYIHNQVSQGEIAYLTAQNDGQYRMPLKNPGKWLWHTDW